MTACHACDDCTGRYAPLDGGTCACCLGCRASALSNIAIFNNHTAPDTNIGIGPYMPLILRHLIFLKSGPVDVELLESSMTHHPVHASSKASAAVRAKWYKCSCTCQSNKPHRLPQVERMGIAGADFAGGLHACRWYFDFNQLYVGAGFLIPHHIVASMLFGSVLSWGIMWPVSALASCIPI